ncbi:hypothetical protein MY04_0666 [Flammeovirga sp. MY04]|uniref:hypothetical protein n=1 Tax=Flammeovirga sp. MY04 TaxID=1191459 RepID=UPI00130530A3|nr:hypothetical protein [Flammeovirga sp. MY04]ANQ48048.2 hypothetical protein MY04_0666 [Flammeovirga sp. MY04]
MKRLLYLVLLLLVGLTANAQTPIGLQFDLYGQPIHGYYDPLSFSSSASVSKNLGEFLPGKVYDKEGNPRKTLTKFSVAKISKKSADGISEAVYPSRYSAVTVGQDSFFVAQNIHFRGRTRNRESFVQYIAEFDSTVFAKVYNMNFNGSVMHQTYIAKKYDEETWEEINPNKKSIEPMIEHFFSKYDNVITQGKTMETGAVNYFAFLGFEYEKNLELNDQSIAGLINIAKITSKFSKDEKTYLNKFFIETRDTSKAKYYTKIKGIYQDYYTKQYFNLYDELMYEVDFKNTKMNELHGNYTMYYNGKLALKKTIEDGEVKKGEVYKDGLLVYSYTNEKVKPEYGSEYTECVFNFGQGDQKTGTFDFYDPFDNLKKFITLDNGVPTSITFNDHGELKSYFVQSGNPFKLKKINRLFQSHIKDQFFVFHDVYKPLLVRMKIDTEGYVKEYQLLNEVNDKFDVKVDEFIKAHVLNGGGKKLRLRPKDKKIDSPLVVIVPFELLIGGQFWFINNNADWMMHQQMMWHNNFMHQQMMHQQNLHHIQTMAPTF